MPDPALLRAQLAKAGAPAGLSKRIETMTNAIDKALEEDQPGFQVSSSNAKRLFSSICLVVKILEILENPTKPVNGVAGKQTSVLAWVLDQGTSPIKADAGRRDEKGRIWVKILNEQKMTDAQQQAFNEKEDAGGKGRGGKRTKTTWRQGELPIAELMKFRIFEETPIHPEKGTKFKKGDIVVLVGPHPVQSFKANEDSTVHDPSFGLTWRFSQMAPDPNEDNPDAPPRKASNFGIMLERNHIVNFSKYPHAWSEDNYTEEDRVRVAKWEAEGTLDKNRFETARMGLQPSDKERLGDKIIIPFGYHAKADQPYHTIKRQQVQIKKIQWGSEWIEKYKAVGNVDKEAAFAELQITAHVITLISTTERKTEKALIKLQLNARADQDGVNQFGIVKTARWANLAPVFLPYVSGYVITSLAVDKSELEPVNQPLLNPRYANGKTKMGFDYGIYTYQFYHAPEICTFILSPTAFPINLACTKVLMRAALGFEDPSAVALSEEARSNPLNNGTRNVINMFETSERPDNLVADYDFYLIYALEEASFDSVEDVRQEMQKLGLDPVSTWSTIFSAPPKTNPAKDTFKLPTLPKVDFNNKANADKFCVFAVRKTEVARVKAGPSAFEMPLTEYAERVIELEEDEVKLYGPLPEGPPPPATGDVVPPVEKRGASVERSASSTAKKASAKKGGSRSKNRAAATTPAASGDDGEGASQSQADGDFFDQ